ncbi:unnamed protein product [Caenorhabditis brenneri]
MPLSSPPQFMQDRTSASVFREFKQLLLNSFKSNRHPIKEIGRGCQDYSFVLCRIMTIDDEDRGGFWKFGMVE